MSFVAPALSMLALRGVAPPLLAVGRLGVRLLHRHAWVGWCVARVAERAERNMRPRTHGRAGACALARCLLAAARARARGSCARAQTRLPTRLHAPRRAPQNTPPARKTLFSPASLRLTTRSLHAPHPRSHPPLPRWACGFAVAQYGAGRSRRRRLRTELTQVLADISGDDLQRLLGALPAWVSYPEYERVTWLNTVIKEVCARARKRRRRAARAGGGGTVRRRKRVYRPTCPACVVGGGTVFGCGLSVARVRGGAQAWPFIDKAVEQARAQRAHPHPHAHKHARAGTR
jgi:hypothetical protein